MFNDQEHKEVFMSLCPGNLLTDAEWIGPVFILTSDHELRHKTQRHINPRLREIDWDKIMDIDFGSGHLAALYWAFSLWAGNSWPKDEGGFVDTMDKAFYMDERLRITATIGLMLRWKLKAVKL